MWCVAWLQARELQQLTGSSEVCSTAALTAGPLTACVPACLPGYSGLGPDKNTTELGQTPPSGEDLVLVTMVQLVVMVVSGVELELPVISPVCHPFLCSLPSLCRLAQ